MAFDHAAFVRTGAAAAKSASNSFYKVFSALARDANMRDACDDDQVLALGALNLAHDLLKGTATLSQEFLDGGFRAIALQRGHETLTERTKMQSAREAQKPAPKLKPLLVQLCDEPDTELAAQLQPDKFTRSTAPTIRPIVFEGLGCAKTLRAFLGLHDTIVCRTTIAGTRDDLRREAASPLAAESEVTVDCRTGSVPYTVANIARPDGLSFQNASPEQLREIITRIVSIEAPINLAMVTKRLRAAFGLGSIRSVHAATIESALQLAINAEEISEIEGGFYVLLSSKRITPRDRTGQEEDVRATANLSPSEIRSAIELQSQNSALKDIEATVIGAAAALGYEFKTVNTNRSLAERIRAEIDKVRAQINHEGEVSLPILNIDEIVITSPAFHSSRETSSAHDLRTSAQETA